MNTVERAAQVLWGIHEEAADCSHRPEHVRRLFIDANAAHRFAQALADAGLLATDEMRAVIDAAVAVTTAWDADAARLWKFEVGLLAAVDAYLAAGDDR